MLNFNKSLDLPSQLEWKFAHEAELLGWTIKARNYNTLVMNCVLVVLAVLLAGASLIMYSVYEGMNQPWRTLSCLFFYLIFFFLVLSMTHQRISCAYRFSKSGVEHCEWKDFPEWTLTFLKWLAGITVVICIFLATIDPSFLLGALIGPGGMALTQLSIAHSKNYQNLHSEYHHYAYEWREITLLALVTNREIVDFDYSIIMEGKDKITTGGVNIFCKRKQKEKVAELIKNYLSPDVPFIKIKADVPKY